MNCRFAGMVAAAAFSWFCICAAAAQQLPRLQEESLAGQQVVLPDAASGKVAVLVFGFSRGSQTPTGAWAKQIRTDYAKSAGIELYQLPVLEEAPRLIRGMIVSGIKKGVPEDQQAKFIPVMHNEAELKMLVGYKEPDDAYIVVLDRHGTVAFQTHGATPGPGYAQLRTQVDSLLK